VLVLGMFFVQFLQLKKAKSPPELAGKNCSPDDSNEPGRAVAAPPGAAISLPWWMLQPPGVSLRQEQEQH